jgi:hypothetical protein
LLGLTPPGVVVGCIGWPTKIKARLLTGLSVGENETAVVKIQPADSR